MLGGEVCGAEVRAPGPGRSVEDHSLSVKPDDTALDGFSIYSFSGDDPIECRDYVRGRLGLSKFESKPNDGNEWVGERSDTYTKVTGVHVYRTATDIPYLQVRTTAGKEYFESHWDGTKWVDGKPAGEKLPYRLPELLAAPVAANVFFCQSEAVADDLGKLGFVATGASGGMCAKWAPELSKWFIGRPVVVLPDADSPGRAHGHEVAGALHSVAASVKLVELGYLEHEKGVSDFLKRDPSGAKLAQACNAAQLWQPNPGDDADSGDDESLIAELAALSPLRYLKRRNPTARRLGIRVADLDKLVAEARESETAIKARWKIEPWGEAVDAAELLTALRDIFNRYLIIPEHFADTMALWTLHTWALDAAYCSPHLMFTSPEMRCGKSRALALLFRLGRRTVLAGNFSAATIFRYIDSACPTLLLDEGETFLKNEQMRGILNCGHNRETAYIVRQVGDRYKEFSVWAPKAIACIGTLAETLRDRSIILQMRRSKRGERVPRLRGQDTDEFLTLRRKAQRWADDNVEQLKNAHPCLPDELHDRAADNWEPLFAIADLAQGDWPAWARAAAVKLTLAAETDTQSLRVRLLASIRDVFEALGADRMSSKSLVAELRKDEAGPWAAFGKTGTAITQRQVANLLADFNIHPKTMHVAGMADAKGYELAQFADAFERYVPRFDPSSRPM